MWAASPSPCRELSWLSRQGPEQQGQSSCARSCKACGLGIEGTWSVRRWCQVRSLTHPCRSSDSNSHCQDLHVCQTCAAAVAGHLNQEDMLAQSAATVGPPTPADMLMACKAAGAWVQLPPLLEAVWSMIDADRLHATPALSVCPPAYAGGGATAPTGGRGRSQPTHAVANSPLLTPTRPGPTQSQLLRGGLPLWRPASPLQLADA
jgi:hypothetical protein